MRLEFIDGHFVLRDASFNATTQLLGRHDWVRINLDDFETDSLRAALRFRRFADDVAEEVIKRTIAREYPVPSIAPPPFLDPHQVEGVVHILTRSRSYLAHAPGAGKTATMIVASVLAEETEPRGQVLFIVPPHLTTNWVREILKFTAWTEVWPSITVIHETAKKNRVDWTADFLIVADSMLGKQWVMRGLARRHFRFVGVDEAHRYKEETTVRARMLFGGRHRDVESFGLVQDAAFSVLASGTPMPNRAIELWAPTYAMDPEAIDFMDRNEFGQRYGAPRLDERGRISYPGTTNETELRERLQKRFMHVVTKDRLDLPEKRRALVFMNGDPRSAEMKAWERKNIARLTFDDIDEDMSRGDLARYRREVGVGKINWTAELVGDAIENANESVLLFAWHREVVEGLAEKLKQFNPGVILGGTPLAKRETMRENFQSGKRKLQIGNIAAMGEGGNWQRGDRVVFGEPSWTDTLNTQCEDRAHRRGRNGMVFCQYVVAPNTLDEVILGSVFAKAAAVRKVIG